jgi:2-iminobutanoate/2-iminopropanoate deaminase
VERTDLAGHADGQLGLRLRLSAVRSGDRRGAAGTPIERQTEIVLEQMKLCLETAGTSLQNVMKCNIYCTSAKHFPTVNAIYARYFPADPPARIFVFVPEWMGPFDIEIDCVAVM